MCIYTKMFSDVMNSSKIAAFSLTNPKKVVRYKLYYCETNSELGDPDLQSLMPKRRKKNE